MKDVSAASVAKVLERLRQAAGTEPRWEGKITAAAERDDLELEFWASCIARFSGNWGSPFRALERDRNAEKELKIAAKSLQQACAAIDALSPDALYYVVSRADLPNEAAEDLGRYVRRLLHHVEAGIRRIDRRSAGRPKAIPLVALACVIGQAFKAITGDPPEAWGTAAGSSRYTELCTEIFALFGYGLKSASSAAAEASKLSQRSSN